MESLKNDSIEKGTTMKIYMFPGQGSQYKGMGGDLFDRYRERIEEADEILGYSIKTLCTEDPHSELGHTQFTQPALYVVNALSYAAKLDDGAPAPDFLAGHSLGEFNALHAAGVFDFATGLRLVQRRGELMGQVADGAMAAVLNASQAEIEQALREHGLHNVYMANYNTPSQIVLSGLREEIARAEELFQSGKVRYYPLATSGAFHSAYMRDAMMQFREELQSVALAEPRIPVVANVTARPYRADDVLETLSSQIASTVRWCESVQYLLAFAAANGQDADFEEIGPGDVLTKLVFTIRGQTPDVVLEQISREALADEPALSDAAVPAASDKVAAWNRTHPIGTRVHTAFPEYGELKTRTEAMVLFGHRAAVYLEGYNGYFDLDEVQPA